MKKRTINTLHTIARQRHTEKAVLVPGRRCSKEYMRTMDQLSAVLESADRIAKTGVQNEKSVVVDSDVFHSLK